MVQAYIKDYPRPQLVRKDWMNLNGSWQFAFDDEDRGEMDCWFQTFPEALTIEVPFTYETKLSGIGDETEHNVVWYKRELALMEAEKDSDRYLLHFEGSDYLTRVWVNSTYVGEHRGGYSRFSFDITKQLEDENNIVVVRVEDSYDADQPRGKQRWVPENFGCWYVQTTGIWKTVWLERVADNYLESLKLTPELEHNSIRIETEFKQQLHLAGFEVAAHISFRGLAVNSVRLPVDPSGNIFSLSLLSATVTPFGVELWSPENPSLYDLEIELLDNGKVVDSVLSYFGMREVTIKAGQVMLNNKPLYQRLILDQGYWKDSHLTPPSEDALIEDIDKIHKLGFNGLRKHQKTEDERFLFWCDVKGMLVWNEYPAAYTYSDRAVDMLTREWLDVIRQNYNHPSIITWVPFNESWGVPQIHRNRKQQQFTEAIYHLTKAIDGMRPVVVNDGWEHTVSDILTLHDYVEAGSELCARYDGNEEAIVNNELHFNRHHLAFAEGYSYKGQPILISEYGGIAFANEEVGWGYGNKVADEASFISRYDAVTSAIQDLPYVVGYCYTQVTDVQQEINGLMDIDRAFKVDVEAIHEINTRRR